MHKGRAILSLALMPLFALTACDTRVSSSGAGTDVQAPPAAPAPAHGYTEHSIFNDRYSSTTEITYVSPVDGKTIICTVYSTGVGTGNSCRVKE